MGVDDLHARRLADDGDVGFWQPVSETRDHAPDAAAADFLVIRQCNMQRYPERRGTKYRHMSENAGDESLHVGCAAAIETARCAVGTYLEGVAGPVLTADRNDIGMTRQRHAAVAFRSDRRKQVRLGAFLVEDT